MKIKSIDHTVLTVSDIQATVDFYESTLGMAVETFGEGRIALKFGTQKINLHQQGNEVEPKAESPTPGSGDLCFVTETPLETAIAHVQNLGVKIIQGPCQRTGAQGPILSFYFRDPDLNLIEVANYA
jgi:catechol 2,3-dioxygenase-like lactoylglutathione lyase family enzyme